MTREEFQSALTSLPGPLGSEKSAKSFLILAALAFIGKIDPEDVVELVPGKLVLRIEGYTVTLVSTAEPEHQTGSP